MNETVTLELKNSMNEKNSTQGIRSRVNQMEDRISNPDDRNLELTQLEVTEKEWEKREESLHDLWDSIKHTNISIISVPKGENMKKGSESLFKEVIAENFPNLERDLDIQAHEASESPLYLNAKRPSPRHIIIKLSKIKEKE